MSSVMFRDDSSAQMGEGSVENKKLQVWFDSI